MATGFEKFSKKTLTESGIELERKPESEKTPVTAATTKKPTEQKPKRQYTAKGSEMTVNGEQIFQMTIQVPMQTKRMLDELKYIHQRSYRELAEEAFNDLYDKLKIK